ncbi:hypothetical protein P5V15_009316 [Pogonomyrmex californicus]
MKAKTKIGMGMKAKKKPAKKETNTSNGETRWCVTDFANFGRSRVLNRRSGQRGESDKRQESRATSTRGTATSRDGNARTGTVSRSVQIRTRTVSRPVQRRTRRNSEKRKKKKTPKRR